MLLWQVLSEDGILINMNIEWWMLDGLLGLVILIAVIRGIIKGIGDTVLRLIGIAGGVALSVFYSSRVAEFITGTGLSIVLYDHIYDILMPEAIAAADSAGNDVANMVGPAATDPISEAMPKTLGGLVSNLTDKTVSAAADRLTEIAISILSVVAIMLAVWFVMFLLRVLYKSLKNESFVIGFVDRLLGMVLGLIRGLILACIVAAAMIPVATIFVPEKVPEILEAMNGTYFAGIIYDINPVMLLVKYVIG